MRNDAGSQIAKLAESVRVLDREGLSGAWVGHLPSAFYRDPTPGNAARAFSAA